MLSVGAFIDISHVFSGMGHVDVLYLTVFLVWIMLVFSSLTVQVFLSWQVGMLLFGNTASRSASLLIVDITSFGSDEVNPILASLPNMAEYGEHMIPEWWA